MAALLKLYVGDDRGFGKLNKAHIVLIPKKTDALEVGNFRSISLPHSFSKLFTKILVTRACKRMQEIAGINQSTFIKGKHPRQFSPCPTGAMQNSCQERAGAVSQT